MKSYAFEKLLIMGILNVFSVLAAIHTHSHLGIIIRHEEEYGKLRIGLSTSITWWLGDVQD